MTTKPEKLEVSSALTVTKDSDNSKTISTPSKKPSSTSKVKRPEQHYPMVEVVWDDAAGLRHGWLYKSDPVVPQLALSVGFLIKDSDDHIIIATDTDGDGSHNGRTQIPRGMIKTMKVLRKKTAKE